ncbi:MAG TPA: hypothetical protein PK228_04930 [Saprospiraceae bacterium]|nr:hypothetical protein [Saprospiraceae bacterium]
MVAETKDSTDWATYGIRMEPPEQTYKQTRTDIQQQRSLLRSAYRNKTVGLDSISVVFTEVLINRIIPYWYGTPWSFEGHTAVPGAGQIACGYFVSTTLEHAGLKVNRYKLAQQAPETEARTVAMGDSVTVFRGGWVSDALPMIQNSLNDGLYFIGLSSSHVGFLLKRRGRLFFLHSNYTYPAEVRIELANGTSVLNSFTMFYIAPISSNKKLAEAWLYGQEVPVRQ